MAQFTDPLGNAYTASEQHSVESLMTLLADYLGSRNTVMPQLDALLLADPQMPMALCLRGYLIKQSGDPRLGGAARQCLQQMAGQDRNPREQLHYKALASWLDQQLLDSLEALEAILAEHPKDMLALRIAHYLHFYADGAINMRDSVERSLAVWSTDEPFYGFLLGMHSFGREEAGDYAAAEAAGRQAIEINPADLWAAHAVTHVFEMQSRPEEGIAWHAQLAPHWQDTNNFAYHLNWHRTLYNLALDDVDSALNCFDDILAGALNDDFYLDVCNAASLLWRLEMMGVNVGERWHTVNQWSPPRIKDDELVFATLHYLMAPARLQDQAMIDKALGHLHFWSKSSTTQGEICRDVGLPLATALVAAGRGQHADAAATLADIADKIYLIGGSHAQRQLFTQIRDYTRSLAAAQG